MTAWKLFFCVLLAGAVHAGGPTSPVTPSTDNSLAVLAYNIYMIIQAPAKNERAAELLSWLRGYDVVVLSEAFDDGVRNDIRAALADEYPYRTSVLGHHPLTNHGRPENGGVAILSRWPIDYEAERIYGACYSVDCGAAKGVKYARIVKHGQRYHVFGTHTQAGGNSTLQKVTTKLFDDLDPAVFADPPIVRRQQFDDLRDFIDDQGIPAHEAVVIAGDLNVDRFDQGEYVDMLQRLDAWQPEPIGLQYTSDSDINPLAGGRSYLDYVLISNRHRQPVYATAETFRPLASDSWQARILSLPWIIDPETRKPQVDLSDHFPVYGRIWYVLPPEQTMVVLDD